MKRCLASLVLCGVVAGPAGAVTPLGQALSPSDADGRSRAKLDFRLVQDPLVGSKPVHNSGMVAQTDVAPNAVIGLGLFKTTPNRPSAGEWRVDERARGSRKAAVKFVLKF